MNQNKFTCDGCGQQFNTRDELQQHRKQCTAVQAPGGEKVKTAGSQTQHS